MSDKKRIDRLFQEKFKDFEKTPNDAVWHNIEAELNKKKKRRVIPIWWRYAGVAALLLLLLTVGNSFFNSSNPTDVNSVNNVVETDTEQTLSNSETKNSIKNTVVNNDNPVIVNSEIDETTTNKNEANKDSSNNQAKSNFSANIKKSSALANSSSKNNSESQKRNGKITNKSKVSEKINASIKENVLANNNLNKIPTKENQLTTVASYKSSETSKISERLTENANNSTANNKTDSTKENETESLVNINFEEKTETIEEAMAQNETNINEDKNVNRWSIAPNAAPVYFNTLGEGSSIASQFNNNSKTGEVNMSYGINASYIINKKLIVRSGVNKVNLGYNTNNVAVFDRANATSVNSLSSIKGSGSNDLANSNINTNVSLISEESVSKIAPESFSTTSSANINQSLGFIEVPVEFQYIVSDKKVGLNVIGGFSSFFLNNNELFSETNTTRTLIGEAVNVNKVSYSANFGLGLNYKVTKKINLNFEPMFKYQINTFNNTSGDFKPYFIGVYTGFGIKF